MMIELAQKTGDVTRVPIALPVMSFAQENFWTAHFGGAYVFQGTKAPVIISVGQPGIAADPGLPLPVLHVTERDAIARWLEAGELVEPIVKARGVDAVAVLRQKMDFILVEAADALNLDLGQATRADLRRIARALGPALPVEFQGLAALLRWVEGAGEWPQISSQHPAYFYTLRARPGPDRDLINMLLSELSPLDVRQMYIVHKERFYASYAIWSERKRGYVADFLAREYAVDKDGARLALFGPEPGMDEAHRPDPKPAPDLVGLVGPWGAVRRGRG